MNIEDKCNKSISGKHVWIALLLSKEFTGTVGYDYKYCLKCVACDMVNDTVSYVGDVGTDLPLEMMKRDLISKKAKEGK